jgi:hypothetical protein
MMEWKTGRQSTTAEEEKSGEISSHYIHKIKHGHGCKSMPMAGE